ncbi:MAG: anion permease, partial [Proteobacteria bacterium]|nr:anion permease [Pseudomonadota bacterium]
MAQTVAEKPAQAKSPGHGEQGSTLWRWVIPIAVGVVLALIPPPAGLAHHAWLYFALFAGIVAALVLEPVPPAAT